MSKRQRSEGSGAGNGAGSGAPASDPPFDEVAQRQRIVHGLTKLTPHEIIAHLKQEATTEDGIKRLAVIFPASLMPTQQMKQCVRCNKGYDPQYRADICIKRCHENTRTVYHGSTCYVSWEECRDCGHSCEDCGNNCDTPCFEGTHTTNPEDVEERNNEDY
jgi:hypothetical protein